MLFAASTLIVIFLVSLMIGRYSVAPGRALLVIGESLWSIVAPGAAAPAGGLSDIDRTVILTVRLPRVVSAMFVGAALAGSGAVLQGLFRNPLVSPGILGVSSGAGLGAALSILLVGFRAWAIQASAFGFGLLAVLVAVVVSKRGENRSVLMLVLAGVMVGALAQALISLVKYVADPEDTLPTIVYWLMGSLSGVTPASAVQVTPPILVGIAVLLAMRWHINVLSAGRASGNRIDNQEIACAYEQRRR